jgi:hypothetical protein
MDQPSLRGATMSARNRTIVRRLLKKLLTDDRRAVGLNSRRYLKGGCVERSSIIRQATAYISLLRITPKSEKPLPTSLNNTVSELRKIGADVRLTATVRLRACEKLLSLEGVNVPRDDDATWALFDMVLGTTAPEEEETVTAKKIRTGARSAALDSIRKALRDDVASGRITTLKDAVEHLRLSESEPTAPLPDDVGAQLLADFKVWEERCQRLRTLQVNVSDG